KQMDPETESRRRELETAISALQHDIAENIWRNPTGDSFSNYYKLLSDAFAREGMAGVEQLVEKAKQRHLRSLPTEKSIPDCLALAAQHLRDRKYAEAGAIYQFVL